MLPNPQIREVNITDYIRIVRKRGLLIAAFLIIIPSIATVYVSTQKPVYRSTVSILAERGQLKITKFDDVYSQNTKDTQFFQTQYKILASQMIAEKVYENLKLSRDPDFKNLKNPVAKIQGMLKVELVKNSNVILVHGEDTDALRAAAVANSAAKAYIQQDIDQRNLAIKEATGWLESQLDGIKRRLQSSEEALNKYLQDNRIVSIPDIDRKNEQGIESLKNERIRVEAELSNASKRYKEKHPKIIYLTGQLQQIDSKIKEETENFLKLNEKMVRYNVLKKEVDSNQQLYTSILTRAKETGVSEKLEASNIRILDSAKPSGAPFKPKKQQSILMSIFFALALGIGLSVFLEYLDSTIRTAEDVSNYLGLPFLGYIPSVSSKDAKDEAQRALTCSQKITTPVMESYRALRTSILFSSPEDKPLKVILVTSSIPGEGKSFISVNLAFIFSQIDKRVLLIDADMRRPKLHKLFGIEQKPGLSAFLTGSASLDSIVSPVFFNNLSVITSGIIPPNPSELLSSGKINSLLGELRLRFDRIIIDSPPLLSTADTALLFNYTDGAILVIKGASTRLEAVLGSKKRAIEAKGKIIGAVINDIEPEKEDKYYYYHYYYTEDKGNPKKT